MTKIRKIRIFDNFGNSGNPEKSGKIRKNPEKSGIFVRRRPTPGKSGIFPEEIFIWVAGFPGKAPREIERFPKWTKSLQKGKIPYVR